MKSRHPLGACLLPPRPAPHPSIDSVVVVVVVVVLGSVVVGVRVRGRPCVPPQSGHPELRWVDGSRVGLGAGAVVPCSGEA